MALLARARELSEAINADKCCPSCLFSFARKLRADEAELDAVRRNCHAFWDTCVRAISLPAHGDPGEHLSRPFLRRLHAATAQCALHAADVALEELVALTFFDGACACLHACLSVGARSAVGRAQEKHKAFSNKRRAWPMRQEDLFPSGADADGKLVDVVKLLRWTADGRTPAPILLLADLLYIAHPLVFPLVLDNQKALVFAVARWICNPESQMMLLGEEELTPHGLHLNEANMEAAMTLIRCLRDAPDADPDALLQFTLDYEGILFNSAEMGLKLLNQMYGKDSSSKLADDIAAFAATLHPRLAQPDSALTPEVLEKVPKTSQLDIAGVLHVLLTTLAAQRRICGGPTCALPARASLDPATTFRGCAQCKLVHYCSKACQKADWKDGRGIPHKTACDLIRVLATIADFRMPRADFERAMRPYAQRPDFQYEFSRFAVVLNRLLPKEVTIRAVQIQREAAAILGREDLSASARLREDLQIVESVLNKQERFASA